MYKLFFITVCEILITVCWVVTPVFDFPFDEIIFCKKTILVVGKRKLGKGENQLRFCYKGLTQ
jgi:hypothetical protein